MFLFFSSLDTPNQALLANISHFSIVIIEKYPVGSYILLNHKKTQSKTRYIRTIKIEVNIHFHSSLLHLALQPLGGSAAIAADKSIQDKTNEQGNFVVITFF